MRMPPPTIVSTLIFQSIHDFLSLLARQGGPFPAQYDALLEVYRTLSEAVRAGQLISADFVDLWKTLGDAFLQLQTLQGHVLLKPHGYAGDFEIIDRIYTYWVSPDPTLAKWDHFFQAQVAPQAVRNRKTYLHALLEQLESVHGPSPVRVLNIASGPGRDMAEYFQQHPDSRVHFDCLDQDEKAISYAQKLNWTYSDRISFTRGNALRFRPPLEQTYDLIWSAGLFDYFDDKVFVWMLRRMLTWVQRHGIVVIGNFSTDNPSRNFMELGGNWYLKHRSQETLERLALEAGASPENIAVGCEPLGTNLFLHIVHGGRGP